MLAALLAAPALADAVCPAPRCLDVVVPVPAGLVVPDSTVRVLLPTVTGPAGQDPVMEIQKTVFTNHKDSYYKECGLR